METRIAAGLPERASFSLEIARPAGRSRVRSSAMPFDPFRDPRAHPPGTDPADVYAAPFDRERFRATRLRLREASDERLGEILIRMGKVRPAQLDRALVMQRLEGLRLGEMLLKLGIIDLATLEQALLTQQGE